jgi:hypothetical protein
MTGDSYQTIFSPVRPYLHAGAEGHEDDARHSQSSGQVNGRVADRDDQSRRTSPSRPSRSRVRNAFCVVGNAQITRRHRLHRRTAGRCSRAPGNVFHSSGGRVSQHLVRERPFHPSTRAHAGLRIHLRGLEICVAAAPASRAREGSPSRRMRPAGKAAISSSCFPKTLQSGKLFCISFTSRGETSIATSSARSRSCFRQVRNRISSPSPCSPWIASRLTGFPSHIGHVYGRRWKFGKVEPCVVDRPALLVPPQLEQRQRLVVQRLRKFRFELESPSRPTSNASSGCPSLMYVPEMLESAIGVGASFNRLVAPIPCLVPVLHLPIDGRQVLHGAVAIRVGARWPASGR